MFFQHMKMIEAIEIRASMVKFGRPMAAFGAWILGMTWQVAGEQLQCQEIRNVNSSSSSHVSWGT